MKTISLVLFVVVLGGSTMQAQLMSFTHAYISGGVAFPAAPDQFLDYWKPGFGFNAGLEYNLAPQYNIVFTASYHRFGFDAGRFFSRLKLDGAEYGVDGGAGTVMSFTGSVHYLVPGYEWIRPTFFAGLGLLFSTRGAVTVDHIGVRETVGSRAAVVPCVPLGLRVAKAYTDKIDIVLDFEYMLGLSKAQDVNSNATSISLGVAIVP